MRSADHGGDSGSPSSVNTQALRGAHSACVNRRAFFALPPLEVFVL